MNNTKNVAIPWLKRGVVFAFIATAIFLLSVSSASAKTSSSHSSASATSFASTNSTSFGFTAASAVAAASASASAGTSHANSSASAYASAGSPDNHYPSNVAVSCSASASNISVGSTVSFSAHATGGTGSYTYSWTGTDGVSGTGSSFSKTYTSAGSKIATVTVTSGGSSASASCSVNVGQLPPPPPPPVNDDLNGSCVSNTSNAEVGDTVTWSATGVTGGNGHYTYSWSGDEGLYGNNQTVSRSYSYSGTKDATVTIHSDGQTITRHCSTVVRNHYVPPYNPPHYHPVYPEYNNLSASCVANQTSVYVGDTVTWSATGVTGGNGYYTYSWSGTDGLYSNNYSAYRNYNTAGTKFAYLTVYSNGQSVTRTCSLYVNNRYNSVITYANTYYPPQQPTYYSGVSLSQVPYTGLESNVKIVLFTLALILWSAVVTYVVVIRRRQKFVPATVSASDEIEQSVRQEVLMSQDNMLNNLESFARSQNVIVSSDALAAIADIAGNDQKKAEALLSSLANRHATGSDWTTLDLSKVQGAIS